MSEERTVEVDVLLELRDYVRASYWFLFKKFKFVLSLIVIAGVAYPALYLSGAVTKNPNNNYWGLLIPFALLALMLGGTYFSSKRQMASNKSLSEPHHYTFSEGGIDVTALSSSGHTSWSNFYEAHETKHNFLLFLSKNLMYVIPKRCFRNGGQIASFKELLKAKLGGKAKLK